MDSCSFRAMDERTMPIKHKAQIAHHYPEPLIPIAPVLSSYSCKWKKQSTPSNSVLSLPSCLHVSSGRAAIALALEHAGIGQTDEVLIPAYHCESMVSPVRWRNATPIFYQINEDASIKESDIASKITSKDNEKPNSPALIKPAQTTDAIAARTIHTPWERPRQEKTSNIVSTR